LLALAAAGASQLPRLTRKKPVTVKTVRVERARVRDVVTSSAAGEVVAKEHATVRCELSARVTAVKHQSGDRVNKGEVIISLDASDLEARLAQARATLEAQSAQLGQADARAGLARRAADRARVLADKGAGTAQLAEDAEAEARAAIEAVRAAKGALGQSEAALRVAQVARGKAYITAPFDGLIIDEHVNVGDELMPGTAIFEIIDDTRLHVEATVDEADASRVQLGQSATLNLDALPGQVVEAKVSKVGPAVRKDLKGARTLPVEAEVVDVKKAVAAGLRAGMSANVEVIVAEKPDVLSLPTNVIVGRGVKRTVFYVDGDHARVRQVEIGVSNWDRTELTGGLKVGDEVVATLNSKELDDGAPIKVGLVLGAEK
jgi:HlyD family secretion protein